MTDHDQFFKNLFQEFFADLLRIVAPEPAARLRAEAPTFLESELFTSFPEGRHRYLDLVARVETRDGESPMVLVHVEVEARAQKGMGRRLLDYYLQLWLEHHQPIVPIVVYLSTSVHKYARIRAPLHPPQRRCAPCDRPSGMPQSRALLERRPSALDT